MPIPHPSLADKGSGRHSLVARLAGRSSHRPATGRGYRWELTCFETTGPLARDLRRTPCDVAAVSHLSES